jgi:hypothetical protein
MVVDDDDFVSCRLVERHRQLDQSKGWYINLGYLWRDGSPFLTRTDSFYELCGTSLIVPASFYAYFSAPGIGETDVARELGSHKLIFDRRPIAGGSFRPFPLRAAIYRLGHSNATQADLDRARKAQSERQGAGRRRIVPAVRRRLRTARDLVFGRALKVELSGKVRSEFFGALA